MPIKHSRRGLLRGLGATFLCAPAIVRAASLDAIRGVLLHPYAMRAMDLADSRWSLTLRAIENNILYGIPFNIQQQLVNSGEEPLPNHEGKA